MGMQWLDPTPDDSCPTCRHFDGRTFPDGAELPLPAHPHCQCLYIKNDQDGELINWSKEPDFARQTYIYHTAWLIREGEPVPPILEPLRPEAEAHNKNRDKEHSQAFPHPPSASSAPSAVKKKEHLMPDLIRLNTYHPPSRIDRDQHIIYGLSAIQSGVEAIGHKMQTDITTIQQVIALGNQKEKGLKSRFTHPGLSSDGLGKFLGRMQNWREENGKAIADLHLSPIAANSPEGDLRSYTEDLAEKEPDMFGMSIVFKGRKVWIKPNGEELDADKHSRPADATSKLPFVRVDILNATDLVDEPAANRDGLFGASFHAFTNTTSTAAERAYRQLDEALGELGMHPSQLPTLLKTYFTVPEAVPAALRGMALFSEAVFDYGPADLESFIHRYVLARQVRPLSVISSSSRQREQYKGDNMEPESTTQETAVAAQPATTVGDTEAILQKFNREMLSMRLKNQGSDLPQPVFDRLQADIENGRIHSEEELGERIADNHTMLAQLAEDTTIDLPRRPITDQDMLSAADRAKNHVEWFFGVEGATAPPYNYRRFDQLYVAMSGDVDFTGRFQPEYVQFAGASPVTLPNLALDAMQKVVHAQFSRLRFYRWYELVTVVEPNDGSLHDPKWIVYGGSGDLPIVPDGDAYTEGQIQDSKETDPFEKRGRYIGITRKMIKNSDIARIRAIPVALATDAVRTRSAKVAAIFTQNAGVGPTLADGNPLFHASRSNVDNTALGTDTSAWEAASEECFDHVEVGSGKKIATFAKFNLVPSALYFQALKNYGYGDGNPTTYNPFAVADRSPEDPRPVVLAVPDWTDADNWAYMADPNIWPTLLMTYSQNPSGGSHPEPELFSVISETAGLMFTNDSMPIKVRDEFAAGVNGGSGIGKRNVP